MKDIDTLIDEYVKGAKPVDEIIEALLKDMDMPTSVDESVPADPEVSEAKVEEPKKEKPELVLVETEYGQHENPAERKVLFSKLFWKPKDVPDHLVTVYQEGVYAAPECPDVFHPPKKAIELFSFASSYGLKSIIVGPTGSGKTLMTEWYAHKTGRPYLRIDHNRELEKATVFGQTHINVDEDGKQSTDFVPGILPNSMNEPTLVVLDELTRAPTDAQIQYQRLLDRRELFIPELKGGAATIHPVSGWMLTATDNTKGNGDGLDVYSASNVQDAATFNRYDCVIDYDYLPVPQEKELIKKFWPEIPEQEAENLSKFSGLMHKAFITREVTVAFSPRNLLSVCKLMSGGMSAQTALDINFISRVSDAEIADVKESFKSVYG